MMSDVIEDTLKEITKTRAEILEQFAIAYLANNPQLNPDNIQLVQRTDENKVIWYFEKRFFYE